MRFGTCPMLSCTIWKDGRALVWRGLALRYNPRLHDHFWDERIDEVMARYPFPAAGTDTAFRGG